MEVLGIGPMEFLFIIIIALIVLGPKDMEKAGRTLGRWLNSIVKSDTWRVMRDTSREIRGLPTRLMREANIEELQKELTSSIPKLDDMNAWKDAPKQYRQKPETIASPPAPTNESVATAKSHPRASTKPSKPSAPKKTSRKKTPSKTARPKSKGVTRSKEPAAKKPKSSRRGGSHA